MRNITKYILAGMIFLSISCKKDMVYLTDPNQITTAQFWKTEADAIAGTTAIYQELIVDGTYKRKYPWIMDVRSDDSWNVTPVTYVMSCLANYTRSSGIAKDEEINQPWECNYAVIWRCNQVLDNIEGINMNADIKARCKSEAHFLRGLSYFNLLNLFHNVVVYKNVPKSVDDFYIAQSKPSDVWDLVYQDFQAAITNCWTKAQINAANQQGRATKAAAAAYLAKAYLMNQRYSDALPLLKDIIDGTYGTYDLTPDFRDNFTNTNENNIESIFEIQYTFGTGSGNGWIGDPDPTWWKTEGYGKSLVPLQLGYGDVCPSIWIWNEFHKEKAIGGGDDGRIEGTFMFPHPGDTTYKVFGYNQDDPNNGFPSFKWSIGNDSALGLTSTYKAFYRKGIEEDPVLLNAWKSDINRRLVRFSDILLLYAECLNETGSTADAAPIIQRVRTRANLPDRTVEFTAYTQDQMREQIYHERALELAGEAWRYVDILRWGWFTNPARLDSLKAHDSEFKRYIPGREYLAIPTTDLQRNRDNLKQNPGW